MEKPAQTDYPIEEILKRRWSPRAFSDRMVESEKMQSLFEAARWAPSSFNEQPWYFIVATKQKLEEHARLLSWSPMRYLSHSANRNYANVPESRLIVLCSRVTGARLQN